jgi:hypothetical protein
MSRNEKSNTLAKPPGVNLANRMVKPAPKITLLPLEELASPFALKALTTAQAKVMTCSSYDPPEVQELARKRLEAHRKKEKNLSATRRPSTASKKSTTRLKAKSKRLKVIKSPKRA